jgi:hypothetical protein
MEGNIELPPSIWTNPKFGAWRTGYRLGFLVNLCRMMQQAGEPHTLKLRLSVWAKEHQRDSAMVKKRMAELEADGNGVWHEDGEYATFAWAGHVWADSVSPRAPQSHAPRPRFPSDDPDYRRQSAHRNGSAERSDTPQSTPQAGANGSAFLGDADSAEHTEQNRTESDCPG